MDRIIRTRNGLTLIELLIATSLITLIILASSGIYLSGWLMFRNAQGLAQAQRNAMIPMAHIVKGIAGAASECDVTGTGNSIEYMQYGIPPTVTSRYTFEEDNHRIIYIPNIDESETFQIIGTNIEACSFTEHHSDTVGIIVDIAITATDNNQKNPYRLTSSVTARYTGTPPVY